MKAAALLAFAGFVTACLFDVSIAFSHSASQTAEYRDLVTALREDIRKTKIVETLRVNTRADTRLIFTEKCEQEGERELNQLASTADVEESFILIPSICLWIEVGYNEKPKSVRIDLDFVDAVLKQHPTLTIYHIQPSTSLSIGSYFPSYKDLISLVLMNADFIWKPGTQIRHRLVTNIGTIEYRFSNEKHVEHLMNRYRASGLHGYEPQNLAYEFMRSKYRNEYYGKIRNCGLHDGAVKQKIVRCSPIQTGAFTLHFWPTD